MKEMFYSGICLLIRTVTWGIMLLAVIAVAVPVMLLEILVDAMKVNE
ncbi:hypothetical protein [Ruminococcus sp. 5_1_39BFAA]